MDLKLRMLLRRYQADPTLENADTFIRALAQANKVLPYEYIESMGEFVQFNCEEIDIEAQIWIERNAVYSKIIGWEHIIYIPTEVELDGPSFIEYLDQEGIPEVLRMAFLEAYAAGARFISFFMN